MQFNERDNGHEIEVATGQNFEVSLTENRTAGFVWNIKCGGEPVCRVVKGSFEDSSAMPGKSGIHKWHFKVDAPGTATIELVYQRPWQDKSAPARIYTLRIRAGG